MTSLELAIVELIDDIIFTEASQLQLSGSQTDITYISIYQDESTVRILTQNEILEQKHDIKYWDTQ